MSLTAKSSVWFAIPVAESDSKRASETFAKWKAMGYRTAAFAEHAAPIENCDLRYEAREYKGWAHAVNVLCGILTDYYGAQWIVTGGADVYPDPYASADTIANECVNHFGGTYGVMQPTGDSYGALEGEPIACVSPWIGREFIAKAYGGTGPLSPDYPHYYADAELFEVAKLRGCLWLRPDLNHYHDHYLRNRAETPAHLQRWQGTQAGSKALFLARKAEGFPGA